ncbi:MAG: hypothetical protein H0W64_02570 [Gammaproteobacteria bacterium]|nr:hypothetical protein [Gammaproteobacteria bacterium]
MFKQSNLGINQPKLTSSQKLTSLLTKPVVSTITTATEVGDHLQKDLKSFAVHAGFFVGSLYGLSNRKTAPLLNSEIENPRDNPFTL